jgi:hypothetical protein
LKDRYSPVADQFADLREIYNWLQGDDEYSFIDVAQSAELTIDTLISHFTHSPTPYYIFLEGQYEINLKDLVDLLLATGNGLLGVANKDDRRAFALFAPALARAQRSKGWIYQKVAEQFGVEWITDEKFAQLNQGKHDRVARFLRYLKREGKKINSPRQLLIFIKKVASLFIRKALRRG